jgi:CheY-like chemotaxis protein
MATKRSIFEGSLILVVEDNPALLRQMNFLLKVAGMEVITAADGCEALAVLQTRTPNLIVSDIDMPNLDGCGLLQHLRADPRWSAIPLILTSERYAYDDLMGALDLGADDYVPKPFDLYDLLDAIARTLPPPMHVRRAAS